MSFLTRCRGSRLLRPRRCGDFGLVSRHKPAEHRFPGVSATPDVEASSITSCCGRRVSFSERRCGVIVCLQSRRRQRVLHLHHDFSFRSDFCSTYYRSCYGRCRVYQGPEVTKAQGCLIASPRTRLPQVKSTRLLDFQTRHKVASGQKHWVA